MPPAVDLQDAVVLLGRFPALAGVDLRVDPGEVVLLRGPNGAGKTTLLRACGGLVPVTRGTARVLGHDLRHDAGAVWARVGYTGPSDGLYDELTVDDNARFWARAARLAPEVASRSLGALGVGDRLRPMPVGRLSTGQRRRVALALLVARRPQLWLLDEPHAGLDQVGRDLIDDLIRRAAGAGATVLMASHELERAGGVAHRLVTLDGGIVHTDEPHRPHDLPVATGVVEVDRGR